MEINRGLDLKLRYKTARSRKKEKKAKERGWKYTFLCSVFPRLLSQSVSVMKEKGIH